MHRFCYPFLYYNRVGTYCAKPFISRTLSSFQDHGAPVASIELVLVVPITATVSLSSDAISTKVYCSNGQCLNAQQQTHSRRSKLKLYFSAACAVAGAEDIAALIPSSNAPCALNQCPHHITSLGCKIHFTDQILAAFELCDCSKRRSRARQNKFDKRLLSCRPSPRFTLVNPLIHSPQSPSHALSSPVAVVNAT